MAKRGDLNVPVIGVAKAGWTLDQLRARARDSVEKYGGLDQAAFDKLSGLLRYVDGDYNEPTTFAALRQALGSAHHPAHYLAIPPPLFGRRRGAAGALWMCERIPRRGRETLRPGPAVGARAEPDPARHVCGEGHLPHRPLPREAPRPQHAVLSLHESGHRSDCGIERTSRACRSRWRKTSASTAAAPSTTRPGAIRDVVQNHLFQVLSNLAMEPPARMDSECSAGREGEGAEVHSRAHD